MKMIIGNSIDILRRRILKIYKSKKMKELIISTYNELLIQWNITFKEKDIETIYGSTHIIEFGTDGMSPLILFHGVGDDSALMWIYNARELSKHFKIYAIDTIGGPGKSEPNSNYNKTFDQVIWIDEVLKKLSLSHVNIAGVSNGSYLTQYYGIMRPEKVNKMICMAGTISGEGSGNLMLTMLKVFFPEALFPTKKNINKLICKLSGENSGVFTNNTLIMSHYTYLLKGFNNMAMSHHTVKTFTDEQIDSIRDNVLFLIGDMDRLSIVSGGKQMLEKYHMSYKCYKGVGHGINHEISDEINKTMIEYFRNEDKSVS